MKFVVVCIIIGYNLTSCVTRLMKFVVCIIKCYNLTSCVNSYEVCCSLYYKKVITSQVVSQDL